jgi:succinate-semialdehyde dehydrogenase/glutarate-semialdehyde dehydrogenase
MSVVHSQSSTTFESINPVNGERVATYPGHTDQEARAILDEVKPAQESWRGLSFSERAKHFRAIAVELRKEADELSRLIALEMGKPLAQGLAEIEKCAVNCDFYAGRAEALLADETLEMQGALVRYQPLGTVLAVMPWNYPLWQAVRCIAPAAMAGNAVVLKHASNVMGTAIALEEVLDRAGLPKGVFRTLKISASQVSAVIQHPTVSAVTLTGSEPAGRSVSATAGAELKPCVLELGGSDPFIVLEDADLEAAARVGAWARNQNAGQSCIAAKRFIVVDAVHDEFLEKFAEEVRALRLGDPMDKETKIGPMARVSLRDELHEQVVRSLKAGARVVVGGVVPDGPGAYYPPTILADVTPGVAAFEQETFGPVAAVIRASGEEEAVRLANRSRFGLGASVWTGDPARGDRVASLVDSGMVFINSMTRSDPHLPFGGIKASGFGRELWVQGIRSFTNVKTVCEG